MKPNRAPVLFLLFAAVSTAIATEQPTEAVRSRIKRQTVTSTNVASVGYSHRLRALEIEFTRGAIYRFLDVPPAVYQGLMSAQSKGHSLPRTSATNIPSIRVRPSQAHPGSSRITTNEAPVSSSAQRQE